MCQRIGTKSVPMRMCSRSGLFDQACERGQVDPGIGQGNKSATPCLTVDRQSFQTPSFEVSVTVLGGIASPVVEAIPSRRTDREVAGQADGTVIEGFCDIEDLAVRMVLTLVGTRVRGIGDLIELYNWVDTLETGLTAEPLVAMPVRVKAIGREGIAVGTDRTSLVVVAAKGPLLLVRVAGVSTQVDRAPHAQTIGRMQEGKEAQARVPGNDIDQ